MDAFCPQCNPPDGLLLRLILLCEILRADDTMIKTIAAIFQQLGLFEIPEEDYDPTPPGAHQLFPHLQLIK